MRKLIRNQFEINCMRAGGKMLANILSTLEKMVAPGVSTMDLENKAAQLFAELDAKPAFQGFHGYPYILCTSVNDNIVHTFPSKNSVLKEGDIINIDCGVVHQGMITDSAITVMVGSVDEKVKHFVETAEAALVAGINVASHNTPVGTIGATIQKIIEGNGYTVIKDLVGHGVGKKLHEPPQVPNFGKMGTGFKLKAGMTIAIEPIIAMGSEEAYTAKNGWDMLTKDQSLACQVEHTILITHKKPEILTKRKK